MCFVANLNWSCCWFFRLWNSLFLFYARHLCNLLIQKLLPLRRMPLMVEAFPGNVNLGPMMLLVVLHISSFLFYYSCLVTLVLLMLSFWVSNCCHVTLPSELTKDRQRYLLLIVFQYQRNFAKQSSYQGMIAELFHASWLLCNIQSFKYLVSWI